MRDSVCKTADEHSYPHYCNASLSKAKDHKFLRELLSGVISQYCQRQPHFACRSCAMPSHTIFASIAAPTTQICKTVYSTFTTGKTCGFSLIVVLSLSLYHPSHKKVTVCHENSSFIPSISKPKSILLSMSFYAPPMIYSSKRCALYLILGLNIS